MIAQPAQLVPVLQIAVYEVVSVGDTVNVLPVCNTERVFVVSVQSIVPEQLLADSVVDPPEQILVFVADKVGVSPNPPTVIVLWAEAEHAPLPQVTV